MIKIGFTGARRGMTPSQKEAVHGALLGLFVGDPGGPGSEFHHGDCVGADYEAAEIAYQIGYTVIAHPPTDEKLRGFYPSHTELPPLPYIQRNHEIVRATHKMIACPAQSALARGGTWATIQYAKKLGAALIIFLPGRTHAESRD